MIALRYIEEVEYGVTNGLKITDNRLPSRLSLILIHMAFTLVHLFAYLSAQVRHPQYNNSLVLRRPRQRQKTQMLRPQMIRPIISFFFADSVDYS